MSKLVERLVKPVEYMTTGMYANAPDLDDRIGDAWLGLAAAPSSWKPNPKCQREPRLGSQTKWAILQAQLMARQGGRAMQRVAQNEDTFVDIDPEDLGIQHLFYDALTPEGGTRVWTVRGGKQLTEEELIAAICTDPQRARIAARVLGIEPLSSVALYDALTAALDTLAIAPTCNYSVPSPEPIVTELQEPLVSRRGYRAPDGSIEWVEEVTMQPAEATEAVLKAMSSVDFDDEQTGTLYDDSRDRDDFLGPNREYEPIAWPKEVTFAHLRTAAKYLTEREIETRQPATWMGKRALRDLDRLLTHASEAATRSILRTLVSIVRFGDRARVCPTPSWSLCSSRGASNTTRQPANMSGCRAELPTAPPTAGWRRSRRSTTT